MSAFDAKRTYWTSVQLDFSAAMPDFKSPSRTIGVGCDFETPKLIVNPISEIRRLRQKYTDQLLTLLALFIALEMFVFSPLQAMGVFAFQGFVIATLLAITAGMFIISDHPAAFAVMSICLAANIVVLLLRLFYPPWPLQHLHTSSCLVRHCDHARSGRRPSCIQAWPRHLPPNSRRDPAVSAHRSRLWGAVRIDRLVGSRCVQGNNIRRQSSSCQLGLLFEFCHSDIDGIRRHCSRASDCAEPMQYRKCSWSTLSGHVIGEACDPRNERAQQGLMSAIGTKQTFGFCIAHVRFRR